MKREDALRQLCKMQDEVAHRIGAKTQCVCSTKSKKDVEEWVPDEVIAWLWDRITGDYTKVSDNE